MLDVIMANYDFSTLNDKDFEELVRDLLSRELKLNLQNFKAGRDKGIDLRYSTTLNKNQVVVQAKHYIKTGFRGLLRNLKKERIKVNDLKCRQYYIATSIALSAHNKDEIIQAFLPIIKSANDIYGNEDLNRMLTNYGDVEKAHFKLWLTSSSILQKIFNNAVDGRSEFLKAKIKRNIEIYVQNASLNLALKILKKYKFILITGQPGVGKTTLAYILIYRLLAKNFSLVYVDKNIKEAEEVSMALTSPQVFYFDDFLGANYFEIINPKSSDSGLINFIERIQFSKNKYLILTTRTTILNTAKQLFEKINQSDIEVGRKELELKDYTDYDKAKILYNHLYYSDLEERNIIQIFKDKNYWKIIRHKNYNPRIIEYITDKKKFSESGYANYVEYVFNSLDHPDELWRHSYENQIKDEDRFLLTTLFSFGNSVNEDILEKAFDKRIEFEIKHNGFQKPNNAFNSVLKRLLDGYITRVSYSEKEFIISFINPSISDFLISYLKKSKSERQRLISSTIYLEQIQKIFESVLKDFSNANFMQDVDFFINRLSKRKYFITSVGPRANYKASFDCKKMLVYTELSVFDEVKERTDILIVEILKDFDFSKITHFQFFDDFKEIFLNRKAGGLVEKYVILNWDIIIKGLINCMLLQEDGEDLIEIFQDFSIDHNLYFKTNQNGKLLEDFVEGLAEQTTYDLINNSEDSVRSDEDLEDLKSEIEKARKEIFSVFNLQDTSYNEFEWFSKFDEEFFSRNKRVKKIDNSELKPLQKTQENFSKRDVDDLFDITRLKNP